MPIGKVYLVGAADMGEKSIDYKRETKHQILDVDPCTDKSQPHKGPLMELLFVNEAQ